MMWEPQKIINNKYGRIVALIDMDCKFVLNEHLTVSFIES